jgi:chondroitin AC lyase
MPFVTGLLAFFITIFAEAAQNDLDVIRQQYMAYILENKPDAGAVAKYIQSLDPEGAWPDIDYADKTRGRWKPAQHLGQIEDMARAYRDPESTYQGNPVLKTAILKALGYWLNHDLICPNWWSNEIQVPQFIANILVLMEKEVPDAMIKRAMDTSLKRAKIGMTGQNKVWLAGCVFARSIIDGNESQMKKACETILSEVCVTTKEGIQPDWSFHQHGPQQQFGNYGKNFGDSITQWGMVFRGTSYALEGERLSIIRHYLLQGPSWIIWQGGFDISACGRQIGKNCQSEKGQEVLGQLGRMTKIDPANAEQYKTIIGINRKDAVNTFTGNKPFWRSDLMVHRRPQWYASVKMSSQRVIGAECINEENVSGLHLADGAMYLYQTGREYENIQPVWDWHRLPGTTCDQSITDLRPGKERCRLTTSFVGGVSDGRHGVAAFDYRRDGLAARKSWFFLDDTIICLGAGIEAEQSGQVLTSVQQSLLQGAVVTPSGPAKKGALALRPGDWVQHADIGYLILDGDKTTLNVGQQKGSWKSVIGRRSDAPECGDVFSLWLDHGRSPTNQSYAYAIFPQASPSKMAQRVACPGFKILSNTRGLQAVEVAGGVQAVFYAPGELKLSSGQTITTDTPCIVGWPQCSAGESLFVAEPTQTKTGLQLKLGGKTISVKLPAGGEAGKTVKVSCK